MWDVLRSLSLKDWLDIGGMLAVLFFSYFMLKLRSVFVTKRTFAVWAKAHMESHDKIDDRLDRGDGEFSSIRNQLDKLATAEQLHGVKINLAELKGEIAELEERIAGHHQVNLRTERMVNTLHEHLLQNGG